ncbi:MAG: hypothetical protein A2021_07190 [Elusimicrobia bacterium GWF2_52_66]|nr:MAG: hypothetical protein A2X33_01485 [Elusimicrobia bacterium GWA2_51_34]OGR86381.1 MAG: hypothetical protein A2021_07190 [Elusimicrobia bacterium GWF2_52_66]HAF96200.1 hypothetical protein [Elusimicrobiota bacterium]HCE97811.1 hypothetical protein [Elusimicrobiota bacterium]
MGEKLKIPARRIMFSKGIYAAEAVKLAVYVFSDRADIKLAFSARGTEAELSGGGQDRPPLPLRRVRQGCLEDAIAGEFINEVLNHQCRLDLAAKNGKIANMIVTKALLSASGETGKTKRVKTTSK